MNFKHVTLGLVLLLAGQGFAPVKAGDYDHISNGILTMGIAVGATAGLATGLGISYRKQLYNAGAALIDSITKGALWLKNTDILSNGEKIFIVGDIALCLGLIYYLNKKVSKENYKNSYY